MKPLLSLKKGRPNFPINVSRVNKKNLLHKGNNNNFNHHLSLKKTNLLSHSSQHIFSSHQSRSVSQKWQNKYRHITQYSLGARYYERYHTRTLKYSFDMVGDVQAGVMSGAWRRPAFLEPMIKHPPVMHWPSMRSKKEHVPVFEYAEDVLREKYIERNPDILLHPLTNYAEDNRWFKHPIDYFVDKQLHYINQGYSQEDAYGMAEADLQYEALEDDKEIELATEQAQLMDVPLRMTPWGYEQLYVSYKDNLAKMVEAHGRDIREELERMVIAKRDESDRTPFTHEELETFSNYQVQNYLEKHPSDRHYFPSDTYEKDSKTPNEFLDKITWKKLFPDDDKWGIEVNTQPQRRGIRDPRFQLIHNVLSHEDDKAVFGETDENEDSSGQQKEGSGNVLDDVLKSLTKKYQVTEEAPDSSMNAPQPHPSAQHAQSQQQQKSQSSGNDAIKRLLKKLKGNENKK